MNKLWAPWRMKYITESVVKQPEGCIFCTKPKESCDKENLILYRGEHAFVMMNAFPYNNGHLMVVPRRHLSELSGLGRDEHAELSEMLRVAVGLLGAAYKAQGYNVGINLGQVAGAGIADHLHWHVVPRWNGDTNFMPVLGDTKVISQSLEDAYDALAEGFKAADLH